MSLLPLFMTRDEEEEAPIKPLSSSPTYNFPSTRTDQDEPEIDRSQAHSTLTFEWPSVKHSVNQLETTLSPSKPVCLKKKALLIGIQNYDSINTDSKGNAPVEGQLKGPHADVRHMQQLLLDCYGYTPDDITVLIDDGDPKHVQPTKDNLIQCMTDLVADARRGDEFYLHFSGHGGQVDDENGDEEDGRDECIMTCDHDIIIDDTLNEILVASLPVGSTFVSTFDSCHSGTVLDLTHYRCNRIYVPWVNKGARRTGFFQNIVRRQEDQIVDIPDNSNAIQTPVIQVSEEPATESLRPQPPNKELLVLPSVSGRHPPLSIITQVDGAATPIEYSISPCPIYCTGECRNQSERDVELKADVISISATRDHQLSWENARGSSMTEALVKVLRKDPHASLKHILTSISHELHEFYMNLHAESRGYKEAIKKINIKRKRARKPLLDRRTVEMDNFQHPELSSHLPLDMNRPWPLTSKPCVPS